MGREGWHCFAHPDFGGIYFLHNPYAVCSAATEYMGGCKEALVFMLTLVMVHARPKKRYISQ